MSVPAPRRKKPTLADEIARTLQAFDILAEELAVRGKDRPQLSVSPESYYAAETEGTIALLDIAERIASRTED